MRRFYLTVYLCLLGTLALFFLLVAVLWHLGDREGDSEGGEGRYQRMKAVANLVAEAAPPESASEAEVRDWLARIGKDLEGGMALFSPGGRLIASHGKALAPPDFNRDRAYGNIEHGRDGVRFDFPLDDGRTLAVVFPWSDTGPVPKWLVALILLGVAVAIGAYPVARRITRRLERVRDGVEVWGDGNLSARAPVEGKDEVATLARSFNHAAERVEALVQGQRDMLASASHELRSPLTRIRMGIELLAERQGRESTGAGPGADMAARLGKDIDELDALIDELLFASRLEAQGYELERSDVDLLGLLAEEAARVGAELSGEAATVSGDPRLLRRLLRNLLENARKHGGGRITTGVRPSSGTVRLWVEDGGPGIPVEERERIFEPFYRPQGMSEGEGGGVGLGLALVKRIAEGHAGSVTCEGAEPGGTRFVVTIPVRAT